MSRSLFDLAKKWIPSRIRSRLIQLIFVRIPHWLTYLSVARYRVPAGLTKEHIVAIPENISIGDQLIYFYYIKRRSEHQKSPVACIIPDVDICRAMVNFFLGPAHGGYVYGESMYRFLIRSFPSLRDMTSDFGRNLNIYLNSHLRNKLKRLGYQPVSFFGSGYDETKDPIYVQMSDKTNQFAQAYVALNQRENFSRFGMVQHYWELFFKEEDHSPTRFPGFSISDRDRLLGRLGVSSKYVCLHIREYGEYFAAPYDPQRETDPRGIYRVENYIPLIEFLIGQGFHVVRMGSKPRRRFPDIPGLIDYASSDYQTFPNDLYISSSCSFFIACRSGVEGFPALFGRPVLGLNYTGLYNMLRVPRLRYVPKDVVDEDGKPLSLSELLSHEVFFAQFPEAFNRYKLRTVDLPPDVLLEAAREMVALVEDANTDWSRHTDVQRQFRKMIRPEHLDLYFAEGVPCDSYLRRVLPRETADRSDLRFVDVG